MNGGVASEIQLRPPIHYLKQNVPPGEKKGEPPPPRRVEAGRAGAFCDCSLTIKRPSLRRGSFWVFLPLLMCVPLVQCALKVEKRIGS
ncbi:hypothetical protein CDAR_172211 [Caerostris darwini]|uniref:Uncharacterized protein n=1 Tax=Caerostris darwini TaxID=1538125 RepID=A0AAV4U3F5_9ARAC|nr:hypothetical protein CDAR_172211 [Caerostris darwini]